jgi:hypothetical protein
MGGNYGGRGFWFLYDQLFLWIVSYLIFKTISFILFISYLIFIELYSLIKNKQVSFY